MTLPKNRWLIIARFFGAWYDKIIKYGSEDEYESMLKQLKPLSLETPGTYVLLKYNETYSKGTNCCFAPKIGAQDGKTWVCFPDEEEGFGEDAFNLQWHEDRQELDTF